MSAPETATKFAPTQSSSVLGGQIVGRSERQAAPPAALKLRLDLNLEVEIAIQAKVNGDITLSLLKRVGVILECTGDVGCKTSVTDALMVEEMQANVLFCVVSLSNPFLTVNYLVCL
ncbi:hypothetical protein EV421DRAFT_1901526 [Armillaria borealis]|uniref:Uncharacterized protein n=1 Tax=Armillaria borealis TaxID=47425 RepID=A0AA39JQ02_9AGAR|nr:hypothetical protein EV421DRAFT_1901526 [Armillaria borealis]